jgi:protein-S-isoprenylcysteine O-methyltransferase Ste14
MEARERREAALFHAAAALACLGWWLWMWRAPQVRASFLGARVAEQAPFLLLVPDLLALVGGGAWLSVAILRTRPEARALAWVHFGAAGYAWALSAVWAARDARAYWGFAGMSALVALSCIVALRLSGVSLLWGPFRFRSASAREPSEIRRAGRRQTALMWSVFFGAIPALLALAERALGWSVHWIDSPVRWLPAALFFVLGGALATWAGREMADAGRGTPLPSTCARELVVSGPYRWIRNPMAAGSLTQGLAVAVAIGSPVVLVYALAGIAAWELLVRHEEEAWLRGRFTDAYERYAARVPCWWPHPRVERRSGARREGAEHLARAHARVARVRQRREDLLERPGRAGLRAQLVEAAQGNQPAPVEDRHAVADALDHVEQVRGVEHAGAAVGPAAQDLLHHRRGGGVQARERLVEHQQRGPHQQRAGQRRLLAHAVAEGGDGVVGALEQVERGQQAVALRAQFGLLEPVQPTGQRQVLARREVLVERRPVGHEGEPAPGRERVLRHVVPGDLDAPGARWEQSDQRAHGGGLARAVGTQEAEDLTAHELEVEPLERGGLAVTDGQAREPDHDRGRLERHRG